MGKYSTRKKGRDELMERIQQYLKMSLQKWKTELSKSSGEWAKNYCQGRIEQIEDALRIIRVEELV